MYDKLRQCDYLLDLLSIENITNDTVNDLMRHSGYQGDIKDFKSSVIKMKRELIKNDKLSIENMDSSFSKYTDMLNNVTVNDDNVTIDNNYVGKFTMQLNLFNSRINDISITDIDMLLNTNHQSIFVERIRTFTHIFNYNISHNEVLYELDEYRYNYKHVPGYSDDEENVSFLKNAKKGHIIPIYYYNNVIKYLLVEIRENSSAETLDERYTIKYKVLTETIKPIKKYKCYEPFTNREVYDTISYFLEDMSISYDKLWSACIDDVIELLTVFHRENSTTDMDNILKALSKELNKISSEEFETSIDVAISILNK